jgi:eukaryotic-like serine/threonine-protein kinase
MPGLKAHVLTRTNRTMIAAQAMALQAGTQLGPYQIMSVIGAGGMGVVYKARDIRLDRIVALKILPENLSCNAERRQRFEREARIVSKLSHPSICVLHDIGHEGGIDFLVMEYLEGESLAERLRRGALPLAEVLRYAVQIVDGLAKAHQNGIVHRDLKPGNIIVSRDGVAKVLDFGGATMIDMPAFEELGTTETAAPQPRTEEGQIVGTVAYMSPEQAQGMRVDARSDIFSFGVLLYELVTGQRPFQGETRLATLSLTLHHEPTSIRVLASDVPVSLDQAILRCWQKVRASVFNTLSN